MTDLEIWELYLEWQEKEGLDVCLSVEEILSLIRFVAEKLNKMDKLRPAGLDEADEESICFCDLTEGAVGAINKCKATVIICSEDIDETLIKNKTLWKCARPRLTFMRLCRGRDTYIKYQIHPSVKIGANCYIAPCAVIKENVIIQANTVIGTDGFGYEKDERGHWEKFPHLGRVIIEKDVGIGSNCVIDRGKLTDTIIGEGTKLDNLCHIAHNVKIGKHCFIAAGLVTGGSGRIGDHTWIGLNVTIRNGVTVGSNVLIGMGSVVVRDVPDNVTVFGNPAKEKGGE